MNEFLILFILKTKSFNIYEIKKFIDINFAPFMQVSTGSIIPTLKKLEQNNFIKSDKIITNGGLRKSIYNILPDGEKYFDDLLNEKIVTSPQLLRRDIEVLMMLLNNTVLTDEQRLRLVEKIQNAINDNIKIIEKSIKNNIMNVEFLKLELATMQAKKNFLTVE